jgi:hypothetical protein
MVTGHFGRHSGVLCWGCSRAQKKRLTRLGRTLENRSQTTLPSQSLAQTFERLDLRLPSHLSSLRVLAESPTKLRLAVAGETSIVSVIECHGWISLSGIMCGMPIYWICDTSELREWLHLQKPPPSHAEPSSPDTRTMQAVLPNPPSAAGINVKINVKSGSVEKLRLPSQASQPSRGWV